MASTSIPQSQPLAPQEQVKNKAGGYVWKVDDMNRLRRFLCLGSEGGSYYTSEKELTEENVKCVRRLLESNKGKDVVAEVTKFSLEGRAAKQNPTLFVLALCCRQDKDVETKKAAYKALPEICRIPTFLFTFVEYAEKLSRGSGWGRAHRRAIGNWYTRFSGQEGNPGAKQLAMHVTKYKNRNGWTHVDLLRLAHPKPESDGVKAVVRYVIRGIEQAKAGFLTDGSPEYLKKAFEFLQAVEDIKKAQSAQDVVEFITRHGLVREHIPTNFLKEQTVWKALLQKMPMTAMIRNLGKMSSIGILEEGSDESQLVIAKLNDLDAIKAARIHPFNVLVALKTYAQGKGEKGKLSWTVNQSVVKALDDAFYKAFKFVEPTNQRYCLALDVSGSMSWGGCVGNPTITPRDAAAALSMVTYRTEATCELVGFSTDLVPLNINKEMNLDTVINTMSQVPMGGTDCARPMVWAKERKKMFDVFIIYTDNETWFGKIHPAAAIREYRQKMGIWNAKVIVCGMSANGFSIADPEDPGMLDMAGFDSAGPEVMRNFVLGML